LKRIEITPAQRLRIEAAAADLNNYLEESLKRRLTSAFGSHGGLPRQFVEFTDQLSALRAAITDSAGQSGGPFVKLTLAPILATVSAYGRRRFVTDLEKNRERALAPEVLAKLDGAKAVVDALLESEWYRETTPLRLPRERDFMTQVQSDGMPPPPSRRPLDDKFAILLRASDLPNDLRIMREECDDRRAPVAIAFVDVDGLKALNQAMGETQVDAFVLPPLMRSIERSTFGHGSAYRHGGDEFVILSPSADTNVGLALMFRLQRDLERTTFEGVPQQPSVSMGLCVVNPDSPLTDRETLRWAVSAKKEAKTVRNIVALVQADRMIGKPEIKLCRSMPA